MSTEFQNTLFLWYEGMFPRRIIYALLMKGLVQSQEKLLRGETEDPNLRLNRVIFKDGMLRDVDPTDPRPVDKSMPCLRIVNTATNTTTWVHESTAILQWLEDMYPNSPPLQGPTPIDRARMNDALAKISEAIFEALYYIKNAAPVTSFWSGLANEDRNHAIALYGRNQMVKALLKVQLWAEETLRNEGWLTPGLGRPGTADVALVTWVYYNELSYSFNVLEDEKLDLLRDWYARFKQQDWWKELEGDSHHPPELAYGPDCREV